MNESEFIVTPDWIIPVIPHEQVLTGYSMVISAGKISALVPSEQVASRYPGWNEITLPNQVLLPGLINTHGHAAMALLRGFADDTPLMEWLTNHIWPVEGKHMGYDYVYDGTSLAIAEMLATGTTCTADSYFFPNAVAKAYMDQHFRAQVSLPVIKFPTAWAENEKENLIKALEVHDQLRNQPLITMAFAPHAPYTVTDEGFEQIGLHAADLGIPIHLHLHETRQEVVEAVAETGKRPFARIRDLGLFSDKLQTVHMTQLLPDEIAYLAEQGTHVAHCPDSNLKLASGFCPVTELVAAGVNVAVGTDGVASNNNLDMLAEIRSAALLAKGCSLDATSVTAAEALAMGTINGAKMLGIDHITGSLEVDKSADFISVDLSGPGFQPVYYPISQVVYSATGHQVTNVWIAGKHLVKDRHFTQLDLEAVIGRARTWQESITTS